MLTTDNSKICGPNGETLWDHVGRLKIRPFLVLIIFSANGDIRRLSVYYLRQRTCVRT